MIKPLIVAKWEFLEKVKSKAFIISLFLTPIIIILFSFLPTMMIKSEDEVTKAIGILDLTKEYFEEIRLNLENQKLSNNIPAFLVENLFNNNLSVDSLLIIADSKVLNDKLEGYLYLTKSDNDSLKVSYRSKSIGTFELISSLEKILNDVFLKKQFSKVGIDINLINLLNNKIEITPIKIKKPGEESEGGFLTTFFSSLVFIILLMMMVIYSGQMLVRSLLEEKSNRLIEILVSSCSANDLLLGKILGLSLLGIFQIFVWIIIGLSLVGTSIVNYSSFENIPLILFYFILGYLFYSSIFVGIGSIVTTEQEAQQITSYLSLILVLPVVFILSVMQNPESLIIKIFSYIPFTLPSIMILKINVSEISLIEHIVAILIILSSTILTIFISSKIFRIGILSFGKMPNLQELRNLLKE